MIRKSSHEVVLVVDDEFLPRITAVELFEELGCEVLEAEGAADALDILEQRPDVSLMFTDCRMPAMTGPELAAVASSRCPNLRIILVTGFFENPAARWPLVLKPYSMKTLQGLVSCDESVP